MKPKIGNIVYVPTALYLSHGRDDIQGGKATISNIDNRGNYLMVSVAELPGRSYNWDYLAENQEKWASEYGGIWAHPDPDEDPQFNQWD
jgi:hypothetical protein